VAAGQAASVCLRRPSDAADGGSAAIASARRSSQAALVLLLFHISISTNGNMPLGAEIKRWIQHP
jgi:hypothetical protein